MTLPDIRTCYPDEMRCDEPFDGPCDYDPMVASFGHKMLVTESDNDYQGDTRYLLKAEDGRYGILVISWGSCSGCDALQACSTWKELDDLRASIARDVVWSADAASALAVLTDEKGPIRPGWNEEAAHVRFVRRATAALTETTP